MTGEKRVEDYSWQRVAYMILLGIETVLLVIYLVIVDYRFGYSLIGKFKSDEIVGPLIVSWTREAVLVTDQVLGWTAIIVLKLGVMTAHLTIRGITSLLIPIGIIWLGIMMDAVLIRLLVLKVFTFILFCYIMRRVKKSANTYV